ncbi:hypothetical protein [Ottowia sp.]|uniref:hypothetical protein n=1 Tax=Ottowia sp. TaxID=1898956 RepID=UPI002C1B28A6|nr:hypothetical protein [Ottowia sp.]HRN76102.1 hypothetical protein [Ottowia sp.]HRQ03292.1 hypothetical protein [Ottowia sp.]
MASASSCSRASVLPRSAHALMMPWRSSSLKFAMRQPSTADIAAVVTRLEYGVQIWAPGSR